MPVIGSFEVHYVNLVFTKSKATRATGIIDPYFEEALLGRSEILDMVLSRPNLKLAQFLGLIWTRCYETSTKSGFKTL